MDTTNYQTINQTMAKSTVSGRYSFLPTSKVVEDFGKLGWRVRSVQEARTNKAENMGFQKHIVRMNHPDFMSLKSVSGNAPEIVIMNSHDAKSAYRIMLGVFRTVCANGLIVSEGMFSNHKIVHKGYCVDSVQTITEDVIAAIPKVTQYLGELSGTMLSSNEQMLLASAASNLRWDPEEFEVNPSSLLRVKRLEDKSPDLFTTYNVIQENMIKGGFKISKKDEEGKIAKPRRVKKITNIGEDVRLNKALWELTVKFSEMKKAA